MNGAPLPDAVDALHRVHVRREAAQYLQALDYRQIVELVHRHLAELGAQRARQALGRGSGLGRPRREVQHVARGGHLGIR